MLQSRLLSQLGSIHRVVISTAKFQSPFLLQQRGRGVSNDNSAIVEYDHVVAAVKEGNPLVLDVRTREEHSEGFIPGAVNVPLVKDEPGFSLSDAEFEKQYGIKKPSPATPIITHCKAGFRAEKYKEILAGLGYVNVKVYSGSFDDWTAKGGKIDK